jgi:hypothetical protein
MMRMNLSVDDVGDVRADAALGRLELHIYDKAGVMQGWQAINVGSQGKALRLAGAFNAIMQEDVSPIYPSAERKQEAA